MQALPEGGEKGKSRCVRLFHTEKREILPLEPVDGKTYRFYCCGPTVYGPAHIGNFRTFVLQDVLRRALEIGGLKTKHVRNITDVDDKTIRDSVAAGQTLEEFTAKWRDQFNVDCQALNCLKPHIEPSAVKHIPEQITMIEELIEKGNAYASDDGSVYFKISSYEGYGKLSRLDTRELEPKTMGGPKTKSLYCSQIDFLKKRRGLLFLKVLEVLVLEAQRGNHDCRDQKI